jgi:predicted nucleic acid-binding Zn ribbon protein
MRANSVGEIEMDCPNCGVYNPEDRVVCWRCDQELPKPPKPKKKKDPAVAMRRMWIIVGIALVIWVLLTWILPMLLGSPTTP